MSTQHNYRVIGHDTEKLDGVAKVTGESKFGADVHLPRMLYGKVLRSTQAHARIVSIDTSKAEAHPEVRAVITGSDLPDLRPGTETAGGPVTQRESYLAQEVMARSKVLFHGQAVAAVAATSESAAEEALGLIKVEYDPLPHVLDATDAMSPESPILLEDLRTRTADGSSDWLTNVAEHLVYKRGDVDSGFAEADVIVEDTFSTQSVHQGYIEPDCETALAHTDGTVEVWSNTQSIYMVRQDIALILDIPLSRINVIPTEVGGAFGGKETPRISPLCVALSQRSGQPVQIRLPRDEVLQATGPGNALHSTIKIGAKSDGTITAIQARTVYDAGAFPGAPLRSALRRAFSLYRTPNLRIDAYDVVTNKPHVAAYRAPGATPTVFSVESTIDQVAEKVGMDPLEFRLKNVSCPGDPMPDGDMLPDISLAKVLDEVRQHSCWNAPLEGSNRGRGIALGSWTMPGGTASAHIILNSDGSVTLVLGAVDLSATRTSLAMAAAEALQLDLDDVHVRIADTDSVAFSDPSAGDRITYVATIAVSRAAENLLNQMKQRTAAEFGVSPSDVVYANKQFGVRDVAEMGLSWDDIARRSVQGDSTVVGFGTAAEVPEGQAIAPNAAAHVADVEVDSDTGKVTLLAYTTFQDAGLAVNPVQVQGQMQGGAVQGIGWALSEEYRYDDEGRLLNSTLLDYRIQTSLDVPMIGAEVLEYPSEDHPMGVRSVGQVPIVPPAGAIANAIHAAVGVRMHTLPMSPEAIWRESSDS